MPVHKVGNKWHIGSGKAGYDSREEAERVWAAVRAKKHENAAGKLYGKTTKKK